MHISDFADHAGSSLNTDVAVKLFKVSKDNNHFQSFSFRRRSERQP